MLGSPFEMIVEAKDIPKDTYIDMAVAEVSRLENLISDWIPTTPH
jgi:thiamine biosynthesis lipoprotein